MLNELKVAMTELVDFVETNEPDILSYNVYFSADEDRMTVMHMHIDSALLAYHMEVAGPEFPPIGEFIDLEALDIPESSGTVWEIGPDGAAEPLVDLPLEETGDAFPNDLVHRERHGDLLITDSLQGTIWQVTDDGEATVWLSDPLLEPNQEAPFFPIGANGIAQTNGCLYVANSTTASLVRVPIAADGTAGTPSLLVQDERLFGADGIALDVRGNVYIAVSAGESIARVTPGGSVNILAESSGLAFPSAVAFGTAPRQERTIYITNYDAVEALMDGTPEPSLVALDIDVTGRSI